VACGQVARSQWALIVDPDSAAELPDGRVGEIWLQGENIGRGYWGRPGESRRSFAARLRSVRSDGDHSAGAAIEGPWLRTGDLGFYLDGDLYVTGRLADLIVVDGRTHYPQDIESTAADASAMVRRGYVVAVTVPSARGTDELVIIAERASGTSRQDPQQAIDAIGSAVRAAHGISVAEVRLLPAGAIPRTTSGKLARWACRTDPPTH
jgi:fatty-acyl-CoA synthase